MQPDLRVPRTAFAPALPIRFAISAPKKQETPTYIPIQPIPAAAAPSTKTGNCPRKIPVTNAGIVTVARKFQRANTRSLLASRFRRVSPGAMDDRAADAA